MNAHARRRAVPVQPPRRLPQSIPAVRSALAGLVRGGSLLAVASLLLAAPAAQAAKGKAAKAPAGKAAAPGAEAAAAPAAPKPTSFDELRATASPAGDLGHLIEPLFSSCTAKDDLGRRQCELIRQWHLERLRTRTWRATADLASIQNQPYDSTVKSLTVTINGCLECGRPPVVAGAPRILATAPPRGMEEGAPVGIDLVSKDLPFDDAAKAKRWLDAIRGRLRTEFVFTVGQPFESKVGKGVSIKLAGYRVLDQCAGDVIASDPPSPTKIKIATRPASCPTDERTPEQIADDADQAKLPVSISRDAVIKVLTPIQQRIYECGEEFELKQGVAQVHVMVPGEGKAKMEIRPPYDKGDVHLCFKAALNEARFPRFKRVSPPVEIDYPFVLRR